MEDLCRLTSWAADRGLPLIPRGAGTGMPGGNVGGGVIVDLSKHFTAVDAPDSTAGTVRVEAGAVAADILKAVESVGFTFPALPSSARWCTIGGMIANDAAGARSFKYGAVRDAIVDLDVVLRDGTPVRLSRDEDSADPVGLGKSFGIGPEGDAGRGGIHEALLAAWPRVRKNSSGYALDRYLRSGNLLDLMIGAEGTLGTITGATLRLHRQPEDQALVLLRARDRSDMEAIVQRATGLGASACEFFGTRFMEVAGLTRDPSFEPFTQAAEALFLIEVDGSAGEVDHQLGALQAAAKSLNSPIRVARSLVDRQNLWKVRHAASPTIARQAEHGLISMQFIEDSVVPVEHFCDYLAGIRSILDRQDMDAVIFGHAGDGNAHVNPLVDVKRSDWRGRVRAVLEDTVDLVASLGGTLSGEHGDGRVRAPFVSRIWDARIVDSFRVVKEAFDPDQVMNPGVILPLPGQDPLDGIGVRFPER